MPLTAQSMLDFSRLKAPVRHAEVLVEPRAAFWLDAARDNQVRLRRADTPLLDSTLSEWRRLTREAVVGSDDAMVFVVGHQPEFFHPGVWAKRVAAARAADAAGGTAVNLVVDNDAPRQTGLSVPVIENGRLDVRHVACGELPAGRAYESMAAVRSDRVEQFASAIHEAMRERYEGSQMPTLIAAISDANNADSWVDQIVAACGAIEKRFDVSINERRISTTWCTPLLIDMLANARRFADSYNNALDKYRRTYRVRGPQRPIPDLKTTDDRCEVPVWAYLADGRRCRVYVRKVKERLRIYADAAMIGEIPVRFPHSGENLESVFAPLDGWHLRPRVLALTMWARLLLADLFIHGIGGAKYDRISDTIMADYYRVPPPRMACVSATLHLDLPHREVTGESVRQLRRAMRDLTFNPQRAPGHNLDELRPLIERRAAAVRRSVTLRSQDSGNSLARRAAYGEIRALNGELMTARRDTVNATRDALVRAIGEFEQGRLARGREYFFGLYDRKALEELLDALPTGADFRV